MKCVQTTMNIWIWTIVAALTLLAADAAAFATPTSFTPVLPAITGLHPGTVATLGFTTDPTDEGTTYDATCTSADGGTTRRAAGTGSPLRVHGLTDGATYACTVAATNTHGTSSATSDSFVASTTPDTLFLLGYPGQKGDGYFDTLLSGCQNPTSLSLEQSCTGSPFQASNTNNSNLMAITDGINIYYTGATGGCSDLSDCTSFGGYKCPIASNGSDCTGVFAGPIGGIVRSFATANGYFFIGQQEGTIYRCPIVNWNAGDAAPDCGDPWDDAGDKRFPAGMLVANDRLYVALNRQDTDDSIDRLLWSCSLEDASHCQTLDNPGKTNILALAAGAGYLWVGLASGIIWRCDLDEDNACTTWDTAGGKITSLSYDGAGTLYAFVEGTGFNRETNENNPSVTWFCPTATKNSCSVVGGGSRNAWAVNLPGFIAAYDDGSGATGVFSAGCTLSPAGADNGCDGCRYPTVAEAGTPVASFYVPKQNMIAKPWGQEPTCAGTPWHGNLPMLYVPPGGVTSPGSAEVEISLSGFASVLQTRCDSGDKVMANVRLSGPYGLRRDRWTDLCAGEQDPTARGTFGVLDEGEYKVIVAVGSRFGRETFTVVDDEVTEVPVNLGPPARRAIGATPGTRLPTRRSLR